MLAWMSEHDLETRAAVYQLTDEAWSRISPELSMEQQCSFMPDYLLDCIVANVQEQEPVHSGFEAAWEFSAWLKHLHNMPNTDKIIARAVRARETLPKL